MKFSINFRLKYYTQNLIKNKSEKVEIKIGDKHQQFQQNELYFYHGPNTNPPENFPFHYGSYKNAWWWGENSGFPLNIKCFTISADGYENYKKPTLQKVRKIDYNHNSIILPLEYNRHWGDVKSVLNKNNNWKKKKKGFIYRGASTGLEETPRLNFIQKYFHKYDIGFSFSNEHPEFLKNTKSIAEMSKYKYQISIEGNDKDSGLNWKLASNSVVLMRPPKFESWLMEGLLKPYRHYVPLADDFSDLEQKLNWCKKNKKKCIKIAKNARLFVKQFMNLKKEKKIYNKILEFYKNKYEFI